MFVLKFSTFEEKIEAPLIHVLSPGASIRENTVFDFCDIEGLLDCYTSIVCFIIFNKQIANFTGGGQKVRTTPGYQEFLHLLGRRKLLNTPTN